MYEKLEHPAIQSILSVTAPNLFSVLLAAEQSEIKSALKSIEPPHEVEMSDKVIHIHQMITQASMLMQTQCGLL